MVVPFPTTAVKPVGRGATREYAYIWHNITEDVPRPRKLTLDRCYEETVWTFKLLLIGRFFGPGWDCFTTRISTLSLLLHHVSWCRFYSGRLRSASGSAQVYSPCSPCRGRVKRNSQLLTRFQNWLHGVAKTISLRSPCLSARLPDACTHLYCWSLSGLLNTAYLCVSGRRKF